MRMINPVTFSNEHLRIRNRLSRPRPIQPPRQSFPISRLLNRRLPLTPATPHANLHSSKLLLMFDEDFSRTCDLVDSGAATARVVLEETGHGIDCFSTLGEDFEESVFDLD